MENIKHKIAEAINMALKEHQVNISAWNLSGAVKTLHIWTERMIVYFKVQSQPVPVLQIKPLGRCKGHCRADRNGAGILNEIQIDLTHVQSSPLWQVLVTLAHELIHLWQAHNGNPPGTTRRAYHNLQFRQKAFELGFFVNKQGRTQCLPGNTLFRNLLKEHNIEVPAVFEPDSQLHNSKPSLNLYQCSCGIKVRIGQSRFNAMCLDCGTPFVDKRSLVQ